MTAGTDEKKIARNKELVQQGLKAIKHTLRAILSYPAGNALAGPIDGVACAVVAAEADLSAGRPVPAAWTDCK